MCFDFAGLPQVYTKVLAGAMAKSFPNCTLSMQYRKGRCLHLNGEEKLRSILTYRFNLSWDVRWWARNIVFFNAGHIKRYMPNTLQLSRMRVLAWVPSCCSTGATTCPCVFSNRKNTPLVFRISSSFAQTMTSNECLQLVDPENQLRSSETRNILKHMWDILNNCVSLDAEGQHWWASKEEASYLKAQERETP